MRKHAFKRIFRASRNILIVIVSYIPGGFNMKGTIKGKVYLGLMMLFAMTLWLAGCSASKDTCAPVELAVSSVAGAPQALRCSRKR